MAQQNADGSSVTFQQRAYNFATNGGGAITYRVVMLAAIGIVWWTLQWALGELTGTLHSIDSRLAAIEKLTPNFDNRINNNAHDIEILRESDRKIWDRISDHDHRITVMEARQPPLR